MASESRSISVRFSSRSTPITRSRNKMKTSPETAEVSRNTSLDYSEYSEAAVITSSTRNTVSKKHLVEIIDTRIATLIATVQSQSDPGLEDSWNKVEDEAVITNVPEEYFEALLRYMDSEGLHTSHLEYDPDTKSILIVELAGFRHEAVALALVEVACLFNLTIGGDIGRPIKSYGSGRHRTGKESDMTLKHHLDTSVEDLEGPFVLEVGDSQSMGSLQRKANMWLARPYIRLVLVISIIQYGDGSLALLFLEYDKVNCLRQGNHFIPTYAKSFGVAIRAPSISAITSCTRLTQAQISISLTDCNALAIPEYEYELPQHVLYSGVPGWNDHTPAIPRFLIDLYRFRRAALGL